MRQWREARGLSLRALAALLGVDHTRLYRWETDPRYPPPAMLDLALAELDRRLKEQQA